MTPAALARRREQAAADLEGAIADLGLAYDAYQRSTTDLGNAIKADLTGRLEASIVMHLARAGLAGYLERKLATVPGSLRELAQREHEHIPELARGAFPPDTVAQELP